MKKSMGRLQVGHPPHLGRLDIAVAQAKPCQCATQERAKRLFSSHIHLAVLAVLEEGILQAPGLLRPAWMRAASTKSAYNPNDVPAGYGGVVVGDRLRRGDSLPWCFSFDDGKDAMPTGNLLMRRQRKALVREILVLLSGRAEMTTADGVGGSLSYLSYPWCLLGSATATAGRLARRWSDDARRDRIVV
ncbi:hypothetical protein K432DRAFT_4361 [Lepidopterella palustris CBS 459.81]|uniref:Uncharacterized protein n=1 Tax=Lepidopterella palustris CBS 459.81 TaxID=1314670 RepID=A0A8E2ED53_9PEZI|nr:hypothetical protein K432DRAFT_4361 [Lepidopterella palustris CBS 459.81]